MRNSIIEKIKQNSKNGKGLSPAVLKTIAVSIAHGTHDTYAGFIAPLLPSLIERLSLTKAEAGFFSLFYQGASILQPLIGHVGDRTNLRKYALLAPAVTGIFISLLGPAPTFSTALFFCLIAGLSSATMHATLPALVSSFSNENVGQRMSIWMIGGELGVMVGPVLVTAMITTFSVFHTPWLMTIGITASIFLSILLRNLPAHTTNTKKGASIPFKTLAAVMLPIAGITLLRSPLRSATLLFVPVFLRESGSSTWFAGIALSIMQGIGIIGTISGGLMADKIGEKKTMAISILGSGAMLVAASLSTGVIQLLLFSLMQISSLIILPVSMTLMQTRFPQNRAMANGALLATMFAINALAGVITGFMYDQIGGQATFMWAGIIALTALPLILLIPNEEIAENLN